jgi:hypothetical protein
MTITTGITCGKCKGKHPSVADVRACYAGTLITTADDDAMEQYEGHMQQQAEAAAEQRYERWLEDGGSASERIWYENEQDRLMNPYDPQGGGFDFHDADGLDGFGTAATEDVHDFRDFMEPSATEKQLAFIASLRAERGITAPVGEDLTKKAASEVITQLKKTQPTAKAPAGAHASSTTPVVPAGRYALVDHEHEPERDSRGGIVNSDISTGYTRPVIRFYKVDTPTEGRWAGRVFVNQQVSDDYMPVKSPAIRDSILRRIAKDPQAAMLLYGKEIGSCGHCGRTLTNEDSRARGIGPVCASKMGW